MSEFSTSQLTKLNLFSYSPERGYYHKSNCLNCGLADEHIRHYSSTSPEALEAETQRNIYEKNIRDTATQLLQAEVDRLTEVILDLQREFDRFREHQQVRRKILPDSNQHSSSFLLMMDEQGIQCGPRHTVAKAWDQVCSESCSPTGSTNKESHDLNLNVKNTHCGEIDMFHRVNTVQKGCWRETIRTPSPLEDGEQFSDVLVVPACDSESDADICILDADDRHKDNDTSRKYYCNLASPCSVELAHWNKPQAQAGSQVFAQWQTADLNNDRLRLAAVTAHNHDAQPLRHTSQATDSEVQETVDRRRRTTVAVRKHPISKRHLISLPYRRRRHRYSSKKSTSLSLTHETHGHGTGTSFKFHNVGHVAQAPAHI